MRELLNWYRHHQPLHAIGSRIVAWIHSLGLACFLVGHLLSNRCNLSRILREVYKLGVLSLPIIIIAGFFVGMVLALQGYYALSDFGAENTVGAFVALTLTRELAPVLGAILFAGRSGSSISTEIGLMKTTEQLSALDLMGIDPINYVYQPRFIAGLISVPILTVIFMAVGLIGAWLVSVRILGIDDGIFWSQMQANMSWQNDVINGMIKSICFGFVVCWIAIFFGHSCVPSSEGVGKATTSTVVFASLFVLGLDFILTALMFD